MRQAARVNHLKRSRHHVPSQCVSELSDIMNISHIDVFSAVADSGQRWLRVFFFNMP